jgi:hypothetical protein
LKLNSKVVASRLPLMSNNFHLVLDTLGLVGEHDQDEEVLAVGLGGDDCKVLIIK